MARILISDSNAPFLRIMKRLLEQEGHELVTTTSGTEALQLAMEESIDLWITSTVLADHNGPSCVLQYRKGVGGKLPILLFTAFDRDALYQQYSISWEELARSGNVHYLHKRDLDEKFSSEVRRLLSP